MNKPFAALSLAAVVGLSACGGEEAVETVPNTSTETSEEQALDAATDPNQQEVDEEAGKHLHEHSGEVPEGLQEAENPAFEIGSNVVIQANHMEGTEGAEGTVAGAYDTTVYTVTYTPTTGGDPVENHKWVIHEELEGAGEEPFEEGTEVTITGDHVEGMQGADAIIESSEQTTIYMVDFISTTTGEEITGHQWFTESELSAQ